MALKDEPMAESRHEMKPIHPKNFTVKVSHCGSDTFNGSYKIWKDPNALKLLNLVANKASEDFVGKDAAPALRYHLACVLLGQLNFPKKKLADDIKNYQKHIDKWKLKEQKKEEKKKE